MVPELYSNKVNCEEFSIQVGGSYQSTQILPYSFKIQDFTQRRVFCIIIDKKLRES